MEPAAAWEPCQLQLANWTFEEPAASLPLEYASIDIPGAFGIEGYEYDVQLQHHLVEYYSAPSRHSGASEKEKIWNHSDASSLVNQVVEEFKDDMDMTKWKMHRYPTCLGAVDKSYTVPRIVAIGPYHHGQEHLKKAENVKYVAACHCFGDTRSLEVMYGLFVPVADCARRLYDKDVMAGIGDDDFRHMMFFDACFLVQYMRMRSSSSRRDIIDESLQRFLRPNRFDIFHDIMLLENQIPWMVVDVVMRFLHVSSTTRAFVYRMRLCLLPEDHHEPRQKKAVVWDERYIPPHLLGLLRKYIVGQSDIEEPEPKPKNMSFSVSAMDLPEIGITLKANQTMEIIDMHLNKKGAIFTELCLAPLSLDRNRASYLVNMAALELCTVESFSRAQDEDTAVCSYVLLLANLVYREEEVQELRQRGLLQRGGGLTNEEALRFLTTFQGLRFGRRYYRIMKQIATYRENSRMKTKLHTFLHNHKKTIAAVVTGVGAIGGIIGTLLSIKKSV